MKNLEENIKAQLPITRRFYNEVEAFYSCLSIEEAVEKAGKGILPLTCSKRGFAEHQYRVGKENCNKGALLLLDPTRLELIQKAKTFTDIIKITDEVTYDSSTNRIGKLWSYDTAQRIGFNKKIYPLEVYLQSGARNSSDQLLNNGSIIKSSIMNGRKLLRKVPASIFPKELSIYEPYIIENLLCVGHNKGWYSIK